MNQATSSPVYTESESRWVQTKRRVVRWCGAEYDPNLSMFKQRIYFDITGSLAAPANSGTRVRLASLLFILSLFSSLHGASFKSVLILNGERAGEIERNVASLLAERIGESGDLPVRITTNFP